MVAIFYCFRRGIYGAYVALLVQREVVDAAYIEPDSSDLNGWIVDCGATTARVGMPATIFRPLTPATGIWSGPHCLGVRAAAATRPRWAQLC